MKQQTTKTTPGQTKRSDSKPSPHRKHGLLERLAQRSQQEVGDILGMSKQSVARIERRALQKLRWRLSELPGEDFNTLIQSLSDSEQ